MKAAPCTDRSARPPPSQAIRQRCHVLDLASRPATRRRHLPGGAARQAGRGGRARRAARQRQPHRQGAALQPGAGRHHPRSRGRRPHGPPLPIPDESQGPGRWLARTWGPDVNTFSSLADGPAWSESGSGTYAGRFPLSVERHVMNTVDRLVPGVTTVTLNARYYRLHGLVAAGGAQSEHGLGCCPGLAAPRRSNYRGGVCPPSACDPEIMPRYPGRTATTSSLRVSMRATSTLAHLRLRKCMPSHHGAFGGLTAARKWYCGSLPGPMTSLPVTNSTFSSQRGAG